MIRKYYNNYVSEINLIPIVNNKGKILVEAETGGGKTFAIVKTFKELSKKNPNVLYIIACPNRSQNLQNAEQYKIFSIVGGKQIDKSTIIASMVYDKAKQIKEFAIKEKKKIVLVIDEAHQIIDSDFRKKALKDLSELEDYSKSIIHLTATPRKIKDRFKYDYSYNLISNEKKYNIENHFLIQLSNEDSISQLIEFLKRIKDENMPYIALNDLKTINLCKKILEKEGYRVGIASSETKDNDIFKSIIEKEMLPTENYDFIFATSVLSCGTTFRNTNVKYVKSILKSSQLDFDDSEQSPARFRNEIKEAYTLVIETEEKGIKCKEAIFKDIDFRVNQYKNKYQKTFDFLINEFGYKQALRNMESILSLDENKKLFFGSLTIEGKKIIIDENKLIKNKYQEYDKQYYYNLKELNKKLKEVIKAKNFKIAKIKDFAKDTLKDDVKEISREIAETKEEEKNKAKEILNSLEKNDLFLLEEFLNDEDIYSLLPEELKKQIKFLKEEETILKLLKKTLKENIPIEKGRKIIAESEKDIEVKEYIKLHNYVMRNKKNIIDTKDEYGIYRSVFDEVLLKKGRITNKKLEELLNDLIDKKILKTKKELSKANANKLMKILKMIYNLSEDKKGYKIYSLKIEI